MGFFDILGAFVPLVIVVALLYGLLVVVRKYGYNIKGKDNHLIDIKVVSTKMIMPKKYVSIIAVEDKLLVLGVSDHSVNLLKELDRPEDYTSANVVNHSAGQGENFIDILKKNFGMK